MYIPDYIGGSGFGNPPQNQNNPFSSVVRDLLKNAFVDAWKHGGITDFKSRAQKLFDAATRERDESRGLPVSKQQIQNSIGGALFDAQEHAGEFAVQTDRAIDVAAEAVATSIAIEVEKIFGSPRSSASASRVSPPSFHCFLAGTEILMADGNKKKVEDITVGDRVRSYDVQTRSFTTGEVRELHKAEESSHYVINGGLLKVTGSHRLYVKILDGAEVWATRDPHPPHAFFAVGDALYLKDEEWVTIKDIKRVSKREQVYNLKTVDPDHTFFANGVLVHNSKESF